MSPKARDARHALGPRQVALLSDLAGADRLVVRDRDRASAVRMADRGLVTMRGTVATITIAGLQRLHDLRLDALTGTS